jgi:hypothetical protein
MATTIGTLTIKGDDLGNLANYVDGYIYTSNNQIQSLTNSILTPGTLVDNLDEYITSINGSYTGTFTYTLDGPGVWNGGTDTIVTITYTDMLSSGLPVIPYFFVLITEDYQYATVWEATDPAVPTLCNTCQLIQLTQCGDDDFRLDLGLADGSYTAFYTDNTSGVIWEQGTNSNDSLGGLQVYQWFATAGMFNQYSFYTLTLRDDNGDPVSWVVNDVEYTCATLTFKVTVNVTD